MVHQYKLNGCNIVIDTCSGSIHSVDEVAYDIIAMYETKDHDEIVSTILSRYADREDVTEEDIETINSTEVESGDWALISLLPFNTTETLTVTMKTGEVFTVKVTDEAVENGANTMIARDDAQMNVNNREEGIILKLFNYSGTATNNSNQTKDIDAINGNATNYTRLREGTGVNNGRTLLFSGSGLGGSEPYNNFTGERPSGMEYYSGKRYSGTVKNELVGGYPQLSDNITKYGSDDGNLDYLSEADWMPKDLLH